MADRQKKKGRGQKSSGQPEQGQRGAQGDQGQRGAQGDQGDQGQRGAQGDQGQRGAQGDWGERAQRGARGERAQRGAQGEWGERAQRGAQGEWGERAQRGARGERAQRGAMGEWGERAQRGAMGEWGERARGAQGEWGERAQRGAQGPRPAGPGRQPQAPEQRQPPAWQAQPAQHRPRYQDPGRDQQGWPTVTATQAPGAAQPQTSQSFWGERTRPPPGQEVVRPRQAQAGPSPAAIQKPPAEPDAGRGRHIEAGAVARPSGEVAQLSAGVQDIVISERGGRRRDFHDLGVFTRQAIAHVKDSKTGATGTPQMLITNHVKLVSRPQWVLYQYHIDFNPPMEARRLRTALLYHHEELLGPARAFDGSILFLPRRLDKVTEVVSQTRNGESVKITITLTNELPPTSPTCFQFYNIIFKRILKILNMTQIGRNYYFPQDAILINRHNLNIWPGFTASILQYESSIMLNIDVSHKVLRNETVYDMLSYYLNQHGLQAGKDMLTKETLGQIVLTQYNNRTYRVDEIFWNMNPQSTFKKYDGSEISFVEYYKTQYGIKIKDLSQPLIANIPKRVKPGEQAGPLILIPELCNLTGLTDRMRSDFSVMRDLAVHTRLPPNQREKVVEKFLHRINRDESVQKELRDWGLSFDSKLLMFQGRTLPAEKIVTTGGSYSYVSGAADWSKEMRGYNLVTAINLNSWLMLFTKRNYGVASELLQNLFKVTGQMGIRINKANMLEVDDSQVAYMKALAQHVTNTTQMVVCVLSNAHKGKYDSIKRYLCVDCPTPSQCVLAKTLSKPHTSMSVATKIALQMNCKMGGALWSLEIPVPEAMIVGIDCYHDTLAGKKSIAAFVASMNKGLTSWFSRCVVQDQRQEIVDGLLVCMLAALQAYRSYQRVLPSKILIYRDGVGDGQLKTIVNYEIKQFTDCIRSVEPNYNPKLLVVVVKKRINARFFGCGSGQLSNPLPGTVVDTEVTRPEWYDFFLISQSVREGTVSPTHYNVIYDTLGMAPDYLQRLTYKLCHLYYNWPGVIRVPAPCQYAHKLAFLVGQSIHTDPHTSLSTKLYYL